MRALFLSIIIMGLTAASARADDWPFKEPQDTAVFTTASVVSGKTPILYVTHDAEDGAWQFHSGESLENQQPKVVALSEIVKLDSSVRELADLPRGWQASRVGCGANWVKSAENGR